MIAREGDRLSELIRQDSYSYIIANIYVGAQDEAELTEKYQRCVRALPFEIDDEGVPTASALVPPTTAGDDLAGADLR